MPDSSLESFPEEFHVGMAARADHLFDLGENDPEHWAARSGPGAIHIGVSVFSDSKAHLASHDGKLRGATTRDCRASPWCPPQDFGAQPGDLNPFGL